MPPMYYLRSAQDLFRRAEAIGLRPSGYAIANAAGLTATTMNKLLNGRPPRNTTMTALVLLFQCHHEDLFEIVDDHPGHS